ncbi:MAG: oligopeptide/dipeptide ABC transporter ATP-binding protein [Bacillota bacterium]
MAIVLQVNNLTVKYQVTDGAVVAVAGVSFTLAPGEILGLVGESGCGKSTLGRLAAVPDASPGRGLPEVPLAGEPPDPRNPPAGCRFHPRCPGAAEVCRREEPPLAAAGEEHRVACHLAR